MNSADIEALVAGCGLRVEADPVKGKRTVAARSFARGSTLLSVRPLYGFPVRASEASAPPNQPAQTQAPQSLQGTADDRCSHCFAQLPGRRPRCSQCHQAQYCSTGCLTEHWTARHYFECGRINSAAVDAAAAELKPEYRQYLRMAVGILCAIHIDNMPEWLRVQAGAWRELVGHRDEHPQYVIRQYEEIARVFIKHREAIGGFGGSEDDVVSLLCRSGCNNFAAYEQHHPRMSGYLCSPVVSLLLNHSCIPNAAFVYADGQQIVRALDDISEGEEIVLAYADGLQPRAERQKQLAAVYFFDCTCEKCSGDQAPRAQIDGLMSRALAVGGQAPEFLPTDYAQPPAAEPWVQNVIGMLLKHSRAGGTSKSALGQGLLDAVCALPARNFSFAAYQHWLECQDECLERISAGNASNEVLAWACVSAMYVLAFYATAYPPYHSLVGFQCLETAKLIWNTILMYSDNLPKAWSAALGLGQDQVAQLAQCALEILQVSAEPAASSVGALSIEAQVALLLSQIQDVLK